MIKFKQIESRLPLIIALVVTILFFGRLFYPEPSIYYYAEYTRSDVWHFNFPLKAYFADSLKNENLPLWNRYAGNGFPILAEGQIGTFNPVNIILFYLFPVWLAFNLSYIFVFLTSFFGAYFFSKKYVKCHYCQIFSALIFSLSSFFTFRVTHFALIQCASYVPWLFLVGSNFTKSPSFKNMIYFITIIFLMITTGHFQIFFVGLIALIIYLILDIEKINPNAVLKKAMFVSISLILALGISSIQLFPTLELLIVSVRKGLVSLENLTTLHSIKQLITLVNPHYFGSPANATFTNSKTAVFWESTVYIGIIPLIFSLLGIVKNFNKRSTRVLIILILISLILSFGYRSPVGFIYLMPILSSMRGAVRFFLIVVLSLSILAGLGLEYFNRLLRNPHRILAYFISLVIVFATVFELYRVSINLQPTVPLRKIISPPEVLDYIPKGSRVYTDYSQQETYFKIFSKYGWTDNSRYLYLKNGVDENSNIFYGVGNIKVYSSIPILRQQFIQLNLDYNLVNLSGAEFIISLRPLENDGSLNLIDKIVSPFEDLPPYYIYKNNLSFPRARFVDNYVVGRINTDKLDKRIFKENQNLSDYVILEEEVTLRKSILEDWNVSILTDEDTKLKLKSSTDSEAILVLADTYYPGWVAYINNVKTKIYPANITQRAVVVPPGENTIEFIYRPVSFYLGVVVSVLTAVFLIIGKGKIDKLFTAGESV